MSEPRVPAPSAPEDESFEAYMRERYHDQINWYNAKAVQAQATYRKMQWTVIILAAVTPILIELGGAVPVIGISYATVPSVIVAIITAGLQTFKYQENWLNYRATCEALRREEYLLRFATGEYEGVDDPRKLFIERVEAMLSQENTRWVSTHRKSNKLPAQEETPPAHLRQETDQHP